MSRLERAKAVLDALDSGAPVARARPAPRGLTQRLCNRGCGAQIIVALLPTGAWCALDRHPTGELSIVLGFARTYGPHMGAVDRFCFHRCKGGHLG